MQGYAAFGVHFTLVIEAVGLLWLPQQCRTLLLVFIKRQAATAQRFKGQLPAFFHRIGTQLRRRMSRTPGDDGSDKQ